LEDEMIDLFAQETLITFTVGVGVGFIVAVIALDRLYRQAFKEYRDAMRYQYREGLRQNGVKLDQEPGERKWWSLRRKKT
jgi:uncharacterized membrane protein YgaE (UPF0421/DUF939 family)